MVDKKSAPNFSAKLPDLTRRQLEELAAKFGATHTQVIILALDRMYRETFAQVESQTEPAE